jgi:hypothetical protein
MRDQQVNLHARNMRGNMIVYGINNIDEENFEEKVLRSNDQGQKQPIKYLFLSKIKARCKPVKVREENFWLDRDFLRRVVVITLKGIGNDVEFTIEYFRESSTYRT